MENRMSLVECAALNVLPGHADRNPIGQDRTESQFFGSRPINRRLVRIIEDFVTALACLFQLGVKVKMFWRPQQRLVQLSQQVERYGGLGATCSARRRRF